MGLFSFVKAAGRAIGIGSAEAAAPPAEEIKKEIASHGLPVDGIDIKVENDMVQISGEALTQEIREKVILAAGNVQGVAQVQDSIAAADATPESVFYTVKKGDTLSAIAKQHYGSANKYMPIFEANKPMLSHPDKIYPGQMLRIPPLAKG